MRDRALTFQSCEAEAVLAALLLPPPHPPPSLPTPLLPWLQAALSEAAG